jgi:hypothetical protein
MKHVDTTEVFSVLEKVLATVTLRIPAPGGAVNLPSIHLFAIAPLGSPSNTYRVSWDVEGVETEEVWLSARCFSDLTILKVTGLGTEKSVFPCDVLGSAKSAKGSFDLNSGTWPAKKSKKPSGFSLRGSSPFRRR